MDERTALTNRITGLLLSQGVRDYDPLRRDRHARLEQCLSGTGRPLPTRLLAELRRMPARLELTWSRSRRWKPNGRR